MISVLVVRLRIIINLYHDSACAGKLWLVRRETCRYTLQKHIDAVLKNYFHVVKIYFLDVAIYFLDVEIYFHDVKIVFIFAAIGFFSV